jgi:hypothetical protein
MSLFKTLASRLILTLGISVLVSLIGCSPNYENKESAQSNATPTPPPLCPPGKYITTDITPAAASPVYFVLTVKAEDRKDIRSIKTLQSEGLVFRLPKGTRIALLPAEVNGAELPTSVVETVDGLNIPTAMVESGERIGTEVSLACNGLNPANQ